MGLGLLKLRSLEEGACRTETNTFVESVLVSWYLFEKGHKDAGYTSLGKTTNWSNWCY